MLKFVKADVYRNMLEASDDTDDPVVLAERWDYIDDLEGMTIVKCVQEYSGYYELTFESGHVEPMVHVMHIGNEFEENYY